MTVRGAAILGVVSMLVPGATAAAGERHALVVAGVAGSPALAEIHRRWVGTFVSLLTGPLRVPSDRVVTLVDVPAGEPTSATRDNVRAALAVMRQRLGSDDLLLVLLVGHGTFDGIDAKFNLVGPDLEAGDWRQLLDGIQGHLIVVNTAGASFPFLRRLAGPRRVVITATDSPAQTYDTVFPQFFVEAFSEPESDLDKDGRLSIGEAFSFASRQTRRWYEQQGRLPTERALLDDTGDGVGKEAGVPGPDGALASRLFLDAGPDAQLSADPALSELIARRDALETAIEELKRKRAFMPADDYARDLERLLVDLARVSRRIRPRS